MDFGDECRVEKREYILLVYLVPGPFLVREPVERAHLLETVSVDLLVTVEPLQVGFRLRLELVVLCV